MATNLMDSAVEPQTALSITNIANATHFSLLKPQYISPVNKCVLDAQCLNRCNGADKFISLISCSVAPLTKDSLQSPRQIYRNAKWLYCSHSDTARIGEKKRKNHGLKKERISESLCRLTPVHLFTAAFPRSFKNLPVQHLSLKKGCQPFVLC